MARTIVALAIAATLLPRVAAAHAFLVRTTPAAGERLGAGPQSVSLQFSEPLAGGERIAIATAAGSPIGIGVIERSEGNSVLRVQLPPLEDDVYVVAWQVLANDGHQSLGEFAFAVGDAGQIPAASTRGAGATAWEAAAASWLLLIGVLLAVGGLASEQLVWSPATRWHAAATPRLPIGWLLIVALVGGGAQLFVLARDAAGGALALGWSDWSGVLRTRPGLLTAIQIGLIAYALWVTVWRALRPWALAPLTLALGAAAVRGHAGAAERWWAAPANVIHLIAVGFWVGALGHLALVAWRLRGDEQRSALAAGARRYAALALGLVAVVVVSGTAVALALLRQPADLVTTRYGQALLVKLALVGVALAFAVMARRRALPANPGIRPRRLARLARVEIASVLAVVLTAAVLANTAPPRTRAAADDLLGPPPLTGSVLRLADLAGPLAVHLAATSDALQARVLAPSGDPAGDAQIELSGRAPGGMDFDIIPRRCGAGCVTTAFPWQAGTTTLTVTVSSKAWGGGAVRFAVPWPPRPEDPDLLARVIGTMRSQPTFTVRERVSSGPGATSDNSFSISGAEFMPLELYANGGASDVHPIPDADGLRRLTFYTPGSSVWYELDIDGEQRIQREFIVSPGHRIERTFSYDDAPAP